MDKTSTTDFRFFRNRVRFYIQKLGLTDYEVVFKHEDCNGTELEDGQSGIVTNACNKIAAVYLNKDWTNCEISEKSINIAALHEVLHLLLGEYWYYAKSRFGSEETLGSVEHAVIRRLENFILRGK
jgi:hypothetical protein